MFKMFFCENKSLNYVVLFCLSVAEAIMRDTLNVKLARSSYIPYFNGNL